MNHNQNYVQPGDVLTLTAPYARATSGLGAKVGSIFGVSMGPVGNGESGQFERTGVHALAKTSAQLWGAGDRIYWDDSNKRCDNVATVGMFIGVATEGAANPSASGRVLLCDPTTLLEGAQAAVADVATANADATFGQPEADLINELKTKLNSLLAGLRTAGIIAT